MLSAMKRATLSAKREVHIYRSAKRDDHQVARPRRADSCERSELRAKRAMRMCERSEQIFDFKIRRFGTHRFKIVQIISSSQFQII